MSIYGEYSPRGYRVLDGQTNKVLFTAGNHKRQPKRVVDPGSRNALGAAMIRRFCAKTTREIAIELHANYGGVKRTDNR